jgi:hypothetical protein
VLDTATSAQLDDGSSAVGVIVSHTEASVAHGVVRRCVLCHTRYSCDDLSTPAVCASCGRLH